LRRQNDKSIFGIDLKWESLFNYFFEFLFCHNRFNYSPLQFFHRGHLGTRPLIANHRVAYSSVSSFSS
jgi:hypothetical protein